MSEAEGAYRITEDDVRHVAKLARLRLTDDEVRLFTGQLAHTLEHIRKIAELDLDGVEPLSHPLDLVNVLRDDVAKSGMPVEEALRNAPQREVHDGIGFFGVPKVIGEGGGA